MKRIITWIVLLFILNTSIGQNLNGYKYVYIQTLTYRQGLTDIWNISHNLSTYFNQKGFTVLTDASIPTKEINQNPCLLLRCFIHHTSTSGLNDVTITLKNCKDKIVYTHKGSARGWSDEAFKKATIRAFENIQQSSHYFNPNLTPKIEYPTVEQTSETEATLRQYYMENKLNQIEGIYKSYQAEDLPYYKIGIKKRNDKYIAIIIESEYKNVWKSGEIKAYFEPSSMKGFYSVKWYMGNKTSYETFGLMENEAILSLEFKNPKTGEKRTDKFIKMYPVANEGVTFNDKTKSSGSGFFLTTDGIIATNAHVVENAESIHIQISNEIGNIDYSAKVLLIDNQNDVALIKINDERFQGLSTIPYTLVEKAEIGENVFTIGYPLNDVMGTNYKVTNGIVSATSGIADDIRYYQISVPLQPGNSGGPLFNNNGNIIGVTSARLNSKAVGTDIENVNYAIKISYLLNLYQMLPNVNSLNTNPKVSNKELKEHVRLLKNYVCLIQVN